jgi:N-methylhydantoinase B/oxoprolinase/acetone carboxylase alpha subunit
MTMQEQFDPIGLEIMWGRLISIADEMWSTLFKTAVSTIIGAAQDFGCEILDARAGSLAHSNRSMPVFNVVMPTVVQAVLGRFPAMQMRPGDVYVTNDPWLCAGHLDDIAVATPVFHGGRLVAFAVSVAHASSIGGSLSSRTVRDIHEEGLRIPLVKLYDAGEPNDTALAFIGENVRTPGMVLTDIEAQLTANQVGVRRIEAFLAEYGLSDLETLAQTVQRLSENAMRDAINALPDGTYWHEVWADGIDEPVHLQCRLVIDGDHIEVDYAGSDDQRTGGGINCTMTYTRGHTVYPLKCLLAPAIPANEGTYRPITAFAPKGSILNCLPPASVGSRTHVGWHIHELLFGALASVLPDKVQAGNGLLQYVRVYGEGPDKTFYSSHFFLAGGRGAGRGRNGVGRNGFPSSARNVPVEVFELRTPVLVRARELRPELAGAGEWCGACGHLIELGVLPDYDRPVSFFVDPDRLRFAAPGLAGGEDGPLMHITVNRRVLSFAEIASGQITLTSADDRIEVWVPGGGGYGPKERRDPQPATETVRHPPHSLEPPARR